jgi:hypothetical protein
LGEAAIRAAARHFVESQFRAGADQQVVVVDQGAVTGLDPVRLGIDPHHPVAAEADALLRQALARRQGDGLRRAPADRDPGVRGREAEPVAVADHGDAMAAAQNLAQLIGRTHAAQTRADDHDCPAHAPSVRFD